ncbi:peptide/nickel transport system substrate-binding protein [Paraburkholderia sp. GV068]|jgi:peptide/nickel transport system substrate-binding protein|uniref:ABC transporter substrate-binding protein n=1 Tax=unclassified Paraburkholderia TaxID=2615204 RepID=UPI000D2F6F2C|nr:MULTISPECIES: ABC transporter substrate-binding protein [unclassified Paraburkholderia]PTQ99088.1 peptide/nickel transport system substrate-binding protein [Paraburkholderia sp. GV072]PUB04580.1 peptide/nickel transport system substrate-binding protein [Paraburkholderia sp. GV068]
MAGLNRREFLISTAATLSAGMPAWALAQSGNVAPRRGGTLNMLINPEPPVLVSIFQTTGPALVASSKVLEGLLAYDFDLRPKPQLATAWTVSRDGLQYSFTLRQNVKWHDGQPFTSADVAFSIELLKAVHPRGRSTFANVTRVVTPDARTAIIELSKPAPFLLKALSAGESPIVPRHLYASGDPLTNPHNSAPIGTGPFRFKSWTRGASIVYERNPDYWDAGKPYIDALVFKVIPDAAARSAAFETGALDLGGENPVPLTDLPRLSQLPQLVTETRGYRFLEPLSEIDFNLDHPILRDLKVRQAIAHAINPQVVQRTIAYGYADISPTPITPGSPYHDAKLSPYAFDIAKAEQLLDAAGYPRKDGVRFRLTHDFLPYGDMYRRQADYVKSALARVGIDVTVRSQDLPAFLKRVYADRQFDFTSIGVNTLFDPSVGVQRLYWSKNIRPGVPFSNAPHYSNADVDRLLESASVETDEGKRVALYQEFQQIVYRDLPILNLVAPRMITLANRRVRNHTVSAQGLEGNLADVFLSA